MWGEGWKGGVEEPDCPTVKLVVVVRWVGEEVERDNNVSRRDVTVSHTWQTPPQVSSSVSTGWNETGMFTLTCRAPCCSQG